MCIHLAWSGISGSGGDPAENARSLAAGRRLLEALRAVGCRRFVGIGTGLEYRESGTPHSETDPLVPRGSYASAKAELLRSAQRVCADNGMELAWIRPFHTYGPDDHPRRFLRWLIRTLAAGAEARVTSGEQRRDYLHVDDAADAIWTVARSGMTGAVNVASGIPVRLADLMRRVAALVGREDLLRLGAIPYRPDEPMVLLADTTRLSSTGWRPRIELDEGLRETVERSVR